MALESYWTRSMTNVSKKITMQISETMSWNSCPLHQPLVVLRTIPDSQTKRAKFTEEVWYKTFWVHDLNKGTGTLVYTSTSGRCITMESPTPRVCTATPHGTATLSSLRSHVTLWGKINTRLQVSVLISGVFLHKLWTLNYNLDESGFTSGVLSWRFHSDNFWVIFPEVILISRLNIFSYLWQHQNIILFLVRYIYMYNVCWFTEGIFR